MHGAAWTDSKLAEKYLEGVRGGIPLAAEQIDVMLRLLGSGSRVESFLDLGCGDGILAQAVLERFPSADAVLADLSPPMLEAARKRLTRWGDQVRFVELDYGEPGWASGLAEPASFGAAISGYSIHHQPDPCKLRIYADIYGLLAPGAFFVNIEHVSSAAPAIESLHDELFLDSLHSFHRTTGDSRTRAELAAEYHYRPDKRENILAPVEDQCAWLRDIGFTDVDCYLKIFELAVFGGRKP